MENINALFQTLKALPNQYRSIPFWAWNDALDKTELKRQLKLMQEQGMGGYIIHSREGLETEYLSDEWMDCVQSCLQESSGNGLECWIYDEDKWPSGSIGGKISQIGGDAFKAKVISCQLVNDDTKSQAKSFASYTLANYQPQIRSLDGFSLIDPALSSEYPRLVFRIEVSQNSEWYNGSCPTDMMNPDAIKSFIDLTHNAYKNRYLHDFGKNLYGFFTDEPNVCDFFTHIASQAPFLPWTEHFNTFFEQKRGYSILEILPLLFLHGKGEESARYDYWLTVSELFLDAYTKQIDAWCTLHNVQSTGHMLYENDLGYMVRTSASVMPHYRFMDMPGIDLLGDQRSEYLTVKQCTSVANQFGKRHVITETYGCTGWDVTFASQKRLGDWQFVMGVTRRCQHLALYSLNGCRKRDYPPSFNYHNTWYTHLKVLEDYFARLSVCTTVGRVQRDLLVIHPITSFWMKSGSALDEDLNHIEMNMGWTDHHIHDLNKEGNYYNELAELLLKAQFDFDFGDEILMKSESVINDEGIHVGTHRYTVILVPPVQNLMQSTFTLLLQFLDTGRSVVWMGPLASYLDGKPNRSMIESLSTYQNFIHLETEGQVLPTLASAVRRPLVITNRFGTGLPHFLCMTRNIEHGEIHTVVNTGSSAQDAVYLNFLHRGHIQCLDLLRDEYEILEPEFQTKGMKLCVPFLPEETKVFIVDYQRPAEQKPVINPFRHPHATLHLEASLDSVCPITLSHENSLTLDTCTIWLEEGMQIGEMPLWEAQKQVRELLGFRPNHYNGAPQRYTWIAPEETSAKHRLQLSFHFNVACVPEGNLGFVMEKPQDCSVECNGLPCELTDSFFLDTSMRVFAIEAVKPGWNEIRCIIAYSEETELEDCHLIGHFGVDNKRNIAAYPTLLHRGDWTNQGLFHYMGSVTYHYELNKLEVQQHEIQLKLGAFKGTLAIIRVAGYKDLFALQGDTVFSLPSGLFSAKATTLSIEIVGSLRNGFGPLHRCGSSCSRISWADFRTTGALYTHNYIVVPMGLFGEVLLYTEA